MGDKMEIEELIKSYAEWIKKEISVAKYGEYYELTTPYLDRFNDYLQIYVKQDLNGNIELTDDGYIIDNLLSSGISLKNGTNRKEHLDKIINNYSLRLEDNNIVAVATEDTFPQTKHMLIQAMLSIDDMFETNNENVKNMFLDDVEVFFNENNIYYSKDFSIIGKTGSIYNYDFHFQRTANSPERFCKVINKANESKRNLTIFNWIDTQEKRGGESQLIVMLNDNNRVNDKDIQAFNNYDIKTVLFSERKQHMDLFKAS